MNSPVKPFSPGAAQARPTRQMTRPAELAAGGLVAPERIAALDAVAARYAVAVTPAMADLIDAADPDDPIARQFIPDPAELDRRPGEIDDPIGDEPHAAAPGIVHRYPDRVLLKLVHVCAVYCRFCFRREMVGPGAKMLTPDEMAAALAYIRQTPAIWEVVITGGDPLVVSPRRIAESVAGLAAIDHVKVIRWHTRLPVVDPERITPTLVEALKAEGKASYVVLHANHARELTPAARAACARLVDAGIPMLSQSVLLKGINDTPEALADLLRALVESRVKPYYLHHGDLAPGTSHLRTTITEGQALMRALRGHVSGICQPTYVLDIPGGHGKVPIGPGYLCESLDPESYDVTDYQGETHLYPPKA
ncbi:Lysine 2,3-aminomutase [Hyphomicrobiales bacterium]|nr:Lysine 2,3-aminomutase [Hyphomicrobiales bacterium]CAH1683444.1 Lysine 2,3-aminomutase [Hyphomicrobiales bacterium]